MKSITSSRAQDGLNMIIAPFCTSHVADPSASRRMIHEDIEIKYFYEGSSTLLIGTDTLTVKAGDVVLINPYEFHSTVGCAEERGKYHLFMIPLDFFDRMGIEDLNLRTLFHARRYRFESSFSHEPRVAEILLRIVGEYTERGIAYRACIQGLVTELFSILLRRGLISNPSKRTESDIMRSYELIEPALNHIRMNYSEDISVDSLASLSKVSKYYFCRVFKTVTGKATMEYLRDYRLNIADIMLGNTNKSVSEISECCGFSDENYFCRCYKARYGISPGKRKKLSSLDKE